MIVLFYEEHAPFVEENISRLKYYCNHICPQSPDFLKWPSMFTKTPKWHISMFSLSGSTRGTTEESTRDVLCHLRWRTPITLTHYHYQFLWSSVHVWLRLSNLSHLSRKHFYTYSRALSTQVYVFSDKIEPKSEK